MNNLKIRPTHRRVKVALLVLPIGDEVPVYFDAAAAEFAVRVEGTDYTATDLNDLTALVWDARGPVAESLLTWTDVLEVRMSLPTLTVTNDQHFYHFNTTLSVSRYQQAHHTLPNGSVLRYRRQFGPRTMPMWAHRDLTGVAADGTIPVPQLVIQTNPLPRPNYGAEDSLVLLLPYDVPLWVALVGAIYDGRQTDEALYNLLRHPAAGDLLRAQTIWLETGSQALAEGRDHDQ